MHTALTQPSERPELERASVRGERAANPGGMAAAVAASAQNKVKDKYYVFTGTYVRVR